MYAHFIVVTLFIKYISPKFQKITVNQNWLIFIN